MSTNDKFTTSQLLWIAVDNPASPVSGDPVRAGDRIGVALTDEDENGLTSVDFRPKVWELSVKGVNDSGNSAVALFDKLYYVDGDTPKISKKSSGYLVGYALETVGSGSTAAIKVATVDGGRAATVDGVAPAGSSDGLGVRGIARATFDPSAVSGHRTQAAHGLGVTIPDNAVIVGGFVDVITTFADGASDNATIAISVEGANDIVSAIAISNGGNPWDAGLHAIVPKANTPESTGIKLTAAREITATVGVHALTAGKLVVFLDYVLSD